MWDRLDLVSDCDYECDYECVCENNYMSLTRAWICNCDYVIGFVCEYKY